MLSCPIRLVFFANPVLDLDISYIKILVANNTFCCHIYQMRKTVRKLARCFPTAIVTGRCRDKVHLTVDNTFNFHFYPFFSFLKGKKERKIGLIYNCFCKQQVYKFVRLAELYYAGSHGMDIQGPTRDSKYNKVSELGRIVLLRI